VKPVELGLNFAGGDNYLPARIGETTIQLRELEPKDDDRAQGKSKSK
jgi:hypothetical protein